jgi:hypothetical protein
MASVLTCRFYFAYCEAAFDARYIHNYQILWVKEAPPAQPAGAAPPAVAADASKRIISSNPVTQVCHATRHVWSRCPALKCRMQTQLLLLVSALGAIR